VERARLADRLERSEARFRDVIERNADAIVVVNSGGVIQFANAAAAGLFGTRAADLVGTPFGYPIAVGESTEVDIVRRGEQPVVVELRVVESEWDRELACIISLRDITERKRAEDDARRLIRARAARSAAVVAARRFRFLAESTAMLSSSLDYERTLAALARLCVAEIADWALIYIMDEEGAVRRLEVAHRDRSKLDLVRELRETPIEAGGSHPVLPVLEKGEPLLARHVGEPELARIAHGPRHLELLRQLGVTSFMLVPLIARGRSLGAIGLVCAHPDRRFGDEDLALAEDLAKRAALAVDNARLYRKAQDATRAKTDLLAVISHDLRTPLNSIIGYAELLTMGVPEPLSDGTRERVERMRAGAQHLLHLINQLLTLSRLDAGREEVNLEAIDLAALVKDVGLVMEPLAQERRLRFQLDIPDRPVRLVSDEGKLRQVLMNLTANAVKFTESGEVRVRVRDSAAGVEIRVEDTGPGIAAEYREQIFEPFWQVDAAQRRADGGTGLGLSVVRRMVELLGGEVSVESEVGVGSAFTVRMPSETPAPAPRR
jgi:signal transduction histidine kinase